MSMLLIVGFVGFVERGRVVGRNEVVALDWG